VSYLDPPPSREHATALVGEELAAYTFIRAWMADDVDKSMLLIEQHPVPQEAALFVLSLVKAAGRALLSADGYQVERALAVLNQWMDDGGRMSRMPETQELEPVAAGLIRASLTVDKFATDRILTRAFEADLDGQFFAFAMANLAGPGLLRATVRHGR
jgi:hypothetical protein